MNQRDPLEKVAPGEPFAPAAATWNEFVDAARVVRAGKLGDTGGDGDSIGVAPSVTVLVRNDSGADVDAGGALRLPELVGDLLNFPLDFRRRPLFIGRAPEAADDVIGLLAEPLRDGVAGVAVIQGLAVCDVEVLETSHRFAAPVPGVTSHLRSAIAGPVRIIAYEGSPSSAGSGCSGSGGFCRAAVLLGAGAGAPTNEVAVLIQGYVTFQDAACGSGECGSGTSSGPQCRPVYHHARLQEKVCGVWCDRGCVWVEDINGQRLETGRRYAAFLVGDAPSGLEAVIIDPSSGGCQPAPVLYGVDAGNRTFTILVGDSLGTLCDTGSGDTVSQSLLGLGGNLHWSRGVAYGWSDAGCGFVAITDLIVANPRGCRLNAGDVVTGHFNRMISDEVINDAAGSGDDGGSCTASYLTDESVKTGVHSIQCCANGGFRIYTYAGNCGSVTVTSCGCDAGSGGAGSGGLFCGQEAVPDQYEFDLTVGTDTCLTCADWNGHHVLDFDGSTTWTKNIVLSCTGPPLLNVTAFTLTCADPYMVLDIGGAQYRLLKSSWSWFGSNVMAQFGSPAAGCTWPASITVSAV